MPSPMLSQVVTDTVNAFRQALPECVGAAIVDMSTGLLLAVDTTEPQPRVVLDFLATQTVEFFQGRGVVTVEDIFRRKQGRTDDGSYMQEILFSSDYLTHLMLRGKARPDLVGVVVCSRSVDVETLFTQTRAVMRKMEADLA